MSSARAPLPNRRESDLTDPRGRDVLKIEVLPIRAHQTVRLVFESVDSPWRQGVWLATEGALAVAGTTSPQLTIWQDTAPGEIEITCEATDGLLRFYNIWDSGRGRRRESLSATSGMAVEVLDGGWRRYSCNDIGSAPEFSKLVFRIGIV
jgi:hypothetical protein